MFLLYDDKIVEICPRINENGKGRTQISDYRGSHVKLTDDPVRQIFIHHITTWPQPLFCPF